MAESKLDAEAGIEAKAAIKELSDDNLFDDWEELFVRSLRGEQPTEFRPPGVTHSAPLGRRSFLQIPPPLRVVS